jgi:hypothetical protein
LIKEKGLAWMLYENVVLTKEEIKFLKQLSKGDPLYPKQEIKNCLYPFVYEYSDGKVDEYGQFITDGRYVISDEGVRYLLYYDSERRKHRLSELRGWITTVIAVLAFILSVTSLSWQVYSWRLKESRKQEEATKAVHVSSYIQ